MATTANAGIVYPVVGNTITPLATHFANLANSVDTMYVGIRDINARMYGTNAARLALTAPLLKEGLEWWATDTNRGWFYNGSAWISNFGRPVAEFGFAPQSFANATELTMGGVGKVYTEVTDVENWHDTVTNPSRFRPNIEGIYRYVFLYQWAVNGTGVRYTTAKKNGVAVPGGNFANTSPGLSGDGAVNFMLYMNGSTDYIEFLSYQSSGGALDMTGNLFIEYIAPRF